MKIKQLLLSNKFILRTAQNLHRCGWIVTSSIYRNRRSKIRSRIAAKHTPIRVVFFITSMSMWRYHELITLLSQSDCFSPLIIPYFPPKTDISIMRANRDAIAAYAEKHSFSFCDGYDFTNNTYSDLKDLKPDIVVYSQPYDWGYRKWGIKAFSKNSLFIFTPYGAAVAEGKHFRDTPLTRVADRIFLGSEIEKKVFLEALPVNHEALTVVGSEIYHKIQHPDSDPWTKTGRKRIIWAPHHSIDDHNSFASSWFEQLAEPMLEIAEKFKGTVDFAFKPHPILRTRLYQKWGKEKTENYYSRWKFISDGEYSDLFAFSDAIIHDCSSFVAEYLYTGKPALYVTDSDKAGIAIGNIFGRECFALHYHGNTPEQIEKFITEVVLLGIDPLKEKRAAFKAALNQTDSPGKKMFDNLL